MMAAMQRHMVGSTDGVSRIWTRDKAQTTEALPTRPHYRLASLCCLQSHGPMQGHRNATLHPLAAAPCTARAQRIPFPHPFLLGANPGHSSPSLENSPADGGRDERICAWLRPNIPRKYSEQSSGQPKGLSDFCSTCGKFPRFQVTGLGVHRRDWWPSGEMERGGRTRGCRGSLNHQSLLSTWLGPSKTSRDPESCVLVLHLILRTTVAFNKSACFSEPQSLFSQNKYNNKSHTGNDLHFTNKETEAQRG